MKTIEDVLKLIDERIIKLGEIKTPYLIPEANSRKDELNDLLYKIKESQMDPQPTTKPFDIDRCINEDGGRCICNGEEYILLNKQESNSGGLALYGNGGFLLPHKSTVQNIPRRKERWINVWGHKGNTECTKSPYASKEAAMNGRGFQFTYIGDPICISVEEA